MTTFRQFDISLRRFKYVIESNGIRVRRRRAFTVNEQFVPFENVGSKIREDRERKLGWLIPAILFFLLAILIFIDRMRGSKVGDGAELFWLVIGMILLVVYAFRRKHSLYLVGDYEANTIEFIGTWIYKRRVNQFIAVLHQQRDLYLNGKYSPYKGLTLDENIACINGSIRPQDGLFLKKLTKHPLQPLRFANGYTETEKSPGVCSLTTEKNARKIVDTYQDKFISEGKYIFISEFSGRGYLVALIGTTADPYEIIRRAETNGANYDIETADIIAKLTQWDAAFGLRLIAIGSDFCEGLIENKNINYKALAADVCEFCPDVVDQGTETVELLEKEIKEEGRIFLWWD